MGGGVIVTVAGSDGVGVGDTVTGGELEVHPLTITRPAARSRIPRKPERYMTMLPYKVKGHDNFWGRRSREELRNNSREQMVSLQNNEN